MSEFDRPTVLLVGGGERMHSALVQALERHGLLVETVLSEKVVEAAFAAAPDVLVLLGDAAEDLGRTALQQLSSHSAASSVPVVLLTDEPSLGSRLDAFKHGVVAVVPKTASADGMARRIADIAKDLPDRPGEVDGDLGEATVDELVALFSQQLRSGILSVTAGDDATSSAQVVLRAGRPVTEAIGELVERLRPMVKTQPGPVRYEFHESPEARLGFLDDEDDGDGADVLAGRRVLLIEQNPARADLLVQELRARDALVVVADGEGNGLDRARTQDPDVVILDGSGVEGWALPAMRRLRREPRLRWASILMVDTEELWPGDGTRPQMDRLCASIVPLLRHDVGLGEQALARDNFDTRLERIGPARMLRALTSTGLGLGLSVVHPRVRVQIDLAEGLVVGAMAFSPGAGEAIAQGPAALAALMGLGSGRVRVEHRDAPAVANVMAPVDDALNVASREDSPIAPSLPPPAGPAARARLGAPRPPKPPPRSDADAARLMGKLEQLLERLQNVLPEEGSGSRRPPPPRKRRPPPPGRTVPRPGKVPRPRPTERPPAPGPADATRPHPKVPRKGPPSRRPPRPSGEPKRPSSAPERPGSRAPRTAANNPRREQRDKYATPLAEMQAPGRPPMRPPQRGPSVRPTKTSSPVIVIAPPTAAATADPHDRPTPQSGLDRKQVEDAMNPARRTPAGPVGTQTLAFGTFSEADAAVGLDQDVDALVASEPPPKPLDDLPAPTPRASAPPVETTDADEQTMVDATASSLTPPWAIDVEDEDDFDIPVIEGTAEPSALNDLAKMGLTEESQAPAQESLVPPPPATSPDHIARPAQDASAEPLPPVPTRRYGLWVAAAVLLLGLGAGGAFAWWIHTHGTRLPWEPVTPVAGPPVADALDAATPTLDAAVSAAPPAASLDASAHAGLDASLNDAGIGDAGAVDAGPDAGALDSGATDAGPPDAGPPDAGPDAGPPDEGPPDAGPPDAGSPDAVPSEAEGADVVPVQRRRQEIAALLRRANYRRNQGEFGEAERLYMQVLRRNQQNARALAGMTRLALARSQNGAAVRWAQQLVSSRPGNPANQVLLGDTLAAAGRRPQAEQAWRRALEINPQYRAAQRRLR